MYDSQCMVFGLTAVQVGTGSSWIDTQRGACHIICTPLSDKIRSAVRPLNRDEAYLIPT